MALTFPTMAEKALAAFESATKTVSLVVIAKRYGGEREVTDTYPKEIVFVFDDDTRLIISGRGKAHKVETLLP